MISFLRYGHLYCCRRYSKSVRELAEGVVYSGVPENSREDEQEVKKIAKNVAAEYPEEPTTCCMTGCANCVWLEYAEKLSAYFRDGGDRAMKDIEERVTDGNMKAFLMHELRMRKKSS